MSEEEDREAALARSARAVAEGELRVEAQKQRIAEMTARGEDTSGAERVLRVFERTLGNWRKHREEIAASMPPASPKSRRG